MQLLAIANSNIFQAVQSVIEQSIAPPYKLVSKLMKVQWCVGQRMLRRVLEGLAPRAPPRELPTHREAQ